MDKETLSNYGWIVICVLVLAVMIALATPFGSFVSEAVQSTTKGLFDVNKNALDAAGVPGLTVDGQEFDVPDMNHGADDAASEFTTLTAKKWNGLSDFYASFTWTDGTNIYYSHNANQYVLNGDTWEPKTWINSDDIDFGHYTWTDGTNIYYSGTYSYKCYVLNGDTWEKKTWENNKPYYFDGYRIWTDGKNTYYSKGGENYMLNEGRFEAKTWNGLKDIDGSRIWTDGTNIYYSYNANQYVLNGDTWEPKTWNGLASFNGSCVWTDGKSIYYSYNANQYVLNGDTWEPKTWNGDCTSFDGSYVWTDGINYYYSDGTNNYVFS